MIIYTGQDRLTHRPRKIEISEGLLGQLWGTMKFLKQASIEELRVTHPKCPTLVLIVKLEEVT